VKFWDSSALVPLVVQEKESAALQKLAMKDDKLLVWSLTKLEILSALQRKKREAVLEEKEFTLATARLEKLSAGWFEVYDLASVSRRAERLLTFHPLRAADALQLAAALVACMGDPEEFSFVTLDENLARAAKLEGFSVVAGFS